MSIYNEENIKIAIHFKMDDRTIVSTILYPSKYPNCVTCFYKTTGANQGKRVSNVSKVKLFRSRF